jgi:hypothetical protein
MALDDPDMDAYEYGRAGPGSRPRPVVRFDAIGEGWELFKAQAGTWILTGLVVLVCTGLIESLVTRFTHQRLPVGGGGFRLAVPPAGRILAYLITSVISGFFLGGMFRMACLQVRGQAIRVGDLFGVIDAEVCRELLIGILACAAALFVAMWFCVVPVFIVAGLLMFTLPLIVDGRLDAANALRTSWNALKGQWLTVTLFHFVLNILSGMGVCLCGVGLLFTMPLYCLSIAVLYRDFFLTKDAGLHTKPLAPDPDF